MEAHDIGRAAKPRPGDGPRRARGDARDSLGWLPDDLQGARILDAGCGTGALAFELAKRGADVVGVDVSPTLVSLARERAPVFAGSGSATFGAGDMLDPTLGKFDYVVAMDSLIHYEGADIARIVSDLAERTRSAIVFTIAPRTAALSVMHAAGKLFPAGIGLQRSCRSPPPRSSAALMSIQELVNWRVSRSSRIDRGFYISQAMEVERI